jgi:cysteinyl-tRNA synthetase
MERGRMLKVFNTLTGRKEVFEPLEPKTVGMYACGVTVYDYSHLGHARSALVFDVIRNYLRYSGYAVKYVRNFTDIDDKIINRASEEGKTSTEIAEKYFLAYQDDMKRLGVAPADVEPKATEHIPDIITMIQALIAKGHAYRLNGDVYYEVKTYPAYGRLSKRKAEDLLAGARVEVDERKRDPMDFALWKSSKAGEPAWDSPWGRGRPGWHIECSAMSMKHLGDTFDIHGGGQDLIFPHHENEIAQSCAATGKEFARYWVHNGFVQVNQEKMSKSLGNFFTIREVFEKWNRQWRTEDVSKRDRLTAEALRYFLLTTHYRSPLDFSDVGLQEAKNALDGFYDLFKRLQESSVETTTSDVRVKQAIEELENSFRQAMDDDFNMPAAIAALHRLRGEINKLPESGLSRQVREGTVRAFREHGNVFGLFQIQVKDWEFVPTGWMDQSTQTSLPPQPKREHPAHGFTIPGPPVPLIEEEKEIQRKVDERKEARQREDFKRADEIRKELWERYHVTLEDRPDGTTRWKR